MRLKKSRIHNIWLTVALSVAITLAGFNGNEALAGSTKEVSKMTSTENIRLAKFIDEKDTANDILAKTGGNIGAFLPTLIVLSLFVAGFGLVTVVSKKEKK